VREQDLAGRVVELVRAAAGPAARAEVLADHTALALTRFANSYIHQNVADATTTVRLRLHLAGRTAAGSTTITSAEGLRDLVDRTIRAARLCPPDPTWPGLTPPTDAGGGNCDEATARAGPDDRAARVRAFVDAAGGLETAGFCRTVYRAAAFANSAGHTAAGRTSEAAMDGIARIDGADGMARLATGRLAELDGAALGARAAAKARAGVDPVELPPGRYEVVLEPNAVADVLENLSMYGFNGKAYAERRSYVEPGAAQFDPAVTLVDDALGPGCLGLPFDAEGTPRRPLVLVEAGVSRAVTHDRRSAAEAGARSTGHAPPTGTGGPTAANLRLEPGDGTAAGLLSGLPRGLLVTDLWYTRVLDEKSLVVTGLTRNGVWLVEDGEVTRAVRNLRFTQSYPRALGPGAVLGVGDTAIMLPDSRASAWWTAPAVRLASWNFTGGSAG
jgi:predicted Zn-dependent protease